jgi:hypothetical protein
VRTTQVTPGGIRVCGRAELTAEELSAVDQLADIVCEQEEARRAALSPEERAAEDARRQAAEERRARLTARLRALP